jgi:hypothetical protein
MCLVQIKQVQIKFPLSGFWTVQEKWFALEFLHAYCIIA